MPPAVRYVLYVRNESEGTRPRSERLADPHVMDTLQLLFRFLNPAMVLLWRLGLGRWADVWPTVGGRMLVVEHRGRRSGRRYLTPLNCTPSNRSLYCVAAFGGRADWYRNSMSNPDAIVWRPDGRWCAHAVDASADPARIDLVRGVLIDSGFAAPAFGFRPRRMTDDEIATATDDYRLVRFDLGQRCDDDYDDLAWLWWPVAIVSVTTLVAARRRVMARCD